MEREGLERFSDLEELIRNFIGERDWDRYHRPKDIAMALSIESSELMELYLWDREPQKVRIEEELGDILFFLIDMSMKVDVDLVQALKMKIRKNEEKYPADLVRGRDHKYTHYRGEDHG